MRKRERQIIVGPLKVFNTVAEAICHSTRRDRQLAKGYFVYRWGKKNFDKYILPLLKAPDGLVSVLRTTPNAFTKAYVEEVAAITDDRYWQLARKEADAVVAALTGEVNEMEKKLKEEPDVRPPDASPEDDA